jgi:cytochrome b6-f complex iron-sulfur subunit
VTDDNSKNKDIPDGTVDARRRKLLLLAAGGAGAVWVGASMYPLYKYLAPQPVPDPFGKEGRAAVDKITPQEVAEPGTGKNGGYAGRGLIVLRNKQGVLKAFDSKCTHAGCNVQYQGTKFYCNCHGGTYDLDGHNIAGPPPRPLTELKVFEDKGILYVAPLKGAGTGKGKG